MQMNKETYERSSLIVTEFETDDVITTSGPIDPLAGLTGGDNESNPAGGKQVFENK